MSRQREARQKEAAKERRAENRRLADTMRRRQQRMTVARKVGIWAGAVVGVGAVLGGISWGVWSTIQAGMVGPTNMASDGLLLSSADGATLTPVLTEPIPAGGTLTASAVTGRAAGQLDVVMYVDYGDPISAAFWNANGEALLNAATGGYITLEIHPVAIDAPRVQATAMPSATTSTTATDPAQTPAAEPAAEPSATTATDPAPTPAPTLGVTSSYDYAQRAANTFACVSSFSPDQALTVHEALVAAQADLDKDGLTDDELVALATGAGVTSSDVEHCITRGSYLDWVEESTARAEVSTPFDSVGSLSTTPTVVVAGQPYIGDPSNPDEFLSFIETVYSSFVAPAETTETG